MHTPWRHAVDKKEKEADKGIVWMRKNYFVKLIGNSSLRVYVWGLSWNRPPPKMGWWEIFLTGRTRWRREIAAYQSTRWMSRGDFFFFFLYNKRRERGRRRCRWDGGEGGKDDTVYNTWINFFFFFILVAEGLAINYTSSAIRRFGMMGFEIEINKEKQKMMWEINHG